MENLTPPKRSPLTLVGDAPVYLREAVGVTAAVQRLPTNNSYFVVYADAENQLFSDTLEKLFAVGIPADQILLAYDVNQPEPAFLQGLAGKVWIAAEESLEDLRHRLASALMAQRHRKLENELTRAEKEVPAELLGASDWVARVEFAHFAHAICLTLELNPAQHGVALREALASRAVAPWPPSLSLPEAVAACSQLAQREGFEAARFREAYRHASVALAPRLRTDLRAAAERCLEALWRTHAHVA